MIRLIAAILAVALCVSPATAQFADQATWAGTSGGTGNAQSVSVANAGALSDLLGVAIRFSPGNSNTSAATLAVSGLAATAIRKPSPTGLVALAGGELIAGVPVTVLYNGTYFVIISGVPQPISTRQVLTSGSGTYTRPTNVRQIKVRMAAGGGGGGSTLTANAGSNGSNTTFSDGTTIGGSGALGGSNGVTGGAGGTGGANPTGATGIVRIAGGRGQSYFGIAGLAINAPGGWGGVNPFGGAGAPIANNNGGAAAANTGAGGAGGGDGNSLSAAGGGAGEYLEFTIDAPAATYSYSVGAGGAGGATSGKGNDGGAGGSGIIIVDEFYNRPANDNFFLEEHCRCAA